MRTGRGPQKVEPRGGHGWSVTGPCGDRHATFALVLATGLGTRGLLRDLGLRVPLTGLRGTVLVTEPAPFELRHVLAETVIGPPGTVGFLAHQQPAGHLVVGGSWYPEGEPDPAHLRLRIVRHAQRALPGVSGLRVVAARSGVRPCLPDRLPVVGEIAPGLFGCFGHGGDGFTTGPGSAAVLADLVLGGVPAVDFDPARFAFGRWEPSHPQPANPSRSSP